MHNNCDRFHVIFDLIHLYHIFLLGYFSLHGVFCHYERKSMPRIRFNYNCVQTTPPVPPRIPIPPRPSNDRLVNIDTDDNCSPAPIPIPRHKYKSATTSNSFAVNAMDRMAFDTSGVHSVGKPPTSTIASVKRTRPLPEQSTTNAINSKTNPNKINLPEVHFVCSNVYLLQSIFILSLTS